VEYIPSLYVVLANSWSVLGIPYVLIAGSLLGAVRSRSLLFCDDDADIAVFEQDYAKVRTHATGLQRSQQA
jgi:hypothetical protein